MDMISVSVSPAADGNAVLGGCTCVVDSETILRFSGVIVMPVGDPGADGDDSTSIQARCGLVQHVNFE